MEILYFLKERTKFIRYFYETAAKPFCETIRKIESSEDPFEPPYSEDGEPPFMVEWSEANTGLEMLGRTCVSMLSESLKLYFRCWEVELGVSWQDGERKKTFENGFVQGYRTYFGEVLGLSWDDCPVNFEILEQVTLARNRDQHPKQITTMRVTHKPEDRNRFSHLFFVSESERKLFADSDLAGILWMNPALHVSRDMLFAAIEQVEVLGNWLWGAARIIETPG